MNRTSEVDTKSPASRWCEVLDALKLNNSETERLTETSLPTVRRWRMRLKPFSKAFRKAVQNLVKNLQVEDEEQTTALILAFAGGGNGFPWTHSLPAFKKDPSRKVGRPAHAVQASMSDPARALIAVTEIQRKLKHALSAGMDLAKIREEVGEALLYTDVAKRKLAVYSSEAGDGSLSYLLIQKNSSTSSVTAA